MQLLKKRSLLRKIIYILGSLLILAAISSWIFFSYYFEDSVNDFLRPKLQAMISAATEGHYELSIGRIIKNGSKLYCTKFEIHRISYDSTESGMTLLHLEADTVWLSGLHILRLLRGNGSFMTRMEMHSPRVTVAEIPPFHGSHSDTVYRIPEKLPVLAFDSIIVTDIQILLPKKYRTAGEDSIIRGASARLADFRLDSATIATEPLLYSKHADLEMPKLGFELEEGVYRVEAGPIHASLSDSLISIDTIALAPDRSEEEFASREKYIRGRMNFRGENITIRGFDMEKFMQARSLSLHKCSIAKWSIDYFCDKRKQRNPHPEAALMPNDAVREFHLPVNIDSLILQDGRIRIRERVPGSKEAGSITFDNARIAAYPYSTDSSCGNCGKPTKISVSALFLNEAPVTATASCELQHSGLDLEIDASVGKFSAKRLNNFLIPNERKEVTDGTVEGGTLKMTIRNGVATTFVAPHYKDLAMKILPKEAGGKRGLIEGIKTFVANTFVLHSTNMGEKALTATTTYSRKTDEEFLQFIWIALRKSLGKVIGGFD